MLDAGGERATCPAVVVEWRRRGDVQKEIEFQQSRLVDPASRVRPGRMIVPTIMVTGNTHFAGDSATYVIEMRNHADGTPIRTIKGSGPASGLFDATKAIARQVLVLFSESQENQHNVIGLIGNGFEYQPWEG